MTTLLTQTQVAEMLGGIGGMQVQKRCRKGEWPHTRIGRAYLFTPGQVAQIITLCAVAPKAVSSPDQSWGRKRRTA